MWDNTDGCVKQYHFTPSIYLISCLSLEFCIIIDIAVGAPVHGKDFVGGMNARDKFMLKLEMVKLLIPELILCNPNFSC